MPDTRPSIVVVCAANREEAWNYIWEARKTDKRKFVYASHPAKLMGMADFEVVRLPGHDKHPRANDIDRTIERNLVRMQAKAGAAQ